MAATEFTPLASAIGGGLIGAAAVMLMVFNGRIAGISGIVGRVLPPYRDADPAGAILFLAGLLAAPIVYWLATGGPPLQSVSSDITLMAIAGLLVGFGANWSDGCTSGHGVCGLSLLSPRALAATLTFMATGFGTVFIARHLAGGAP